MNCKHYVNFNISTTFNLWSFRDPYQGANLIVMIPGQKSKYRTEKISKQERYH